MKLKILTAFRLTMRKFGVSFFVFVGLVVHKKESNSLFSGVLRKKMHKSSFNLTFLIHGMTARVKNSSGTEFRTNCNKLNQVETANKKSNLSTGLSCF